MNNWRALKASFSKRRKTSNSDGHILGRIDDMLVIRGINVFPSQIEHVLMSIPEVGTHFQIVVERIKHLDELTVRCELEQEFFTGDVEDLQRVIRKVEHALRDTLNVRTKVELVEKGTIARTEGN